MYIIQPICITLNPNKTSSISSKTWLMNSKMSTCKSSEKNAKNHSNLQNSNSKAQLHC